MKMPHKPTTQNVSEETVLRSFSKSAIHISPEEAQHDLDTTTVNDYDDWFLRALHERESETVCAGYGGIQHPTSRLFEIGIDSVRAGKPSELFLTLLEEIGKMAEERDVMAALFPETFKGRIKTTTVRAAQREAQIVAKFKEHIRKYLEGAKTAKVTGSADKGGKWSRIERTYAEAIANFKKGLNQDERKAIDRALINQGAAIIEWRDEFVRRRKTATES
jgi:hypothetical protein